MNNAQTYQAIFNITLRLTLVATQLGFVSNPAKDPNPVTTTVGFDGAITKLSNCNLLISQCNHLISVLTINTSKTDQ